MRPVPSHDELVQLAQRSRIDKAAIARLISVVERGGNGAATVAEVVHPLGGSGAIVGLTGAPGAGKSTLTSALCGEIRARGDRVGVLAIDPSSPFSGGAILGDRIRMGDHTTDEGVFIRSMATRGHLGGLALATPQAVRVLDAAGLPWIVVETVGVGQVEVEIAGSADTVVVVVNPGWGDAVQAAKAGLMEIADIFVINKADRPGVDNTERDLLSMLELSPRQAWTPPVLRCVATEPTGVAELLTALDEHRRHLVGSGELERRRTERARSELVGVISALLAQRAQQAVGGDRFAALLSAVVRREVDPWTAAESVLAPIQ
jgi:LAO/AO transport system kinase